MGIELGLPVSVLEQLPAREVQEWRAYFKIVDTSTTTTDPTLKQPQKLTPEQEEVRQTALWEQFINQ